MIHSQKYARVERERRFLLAGRPIDLVNAPYALIDDLYIRNSRLRLRKVERADRGVEYKLSQKIDIDASHRLVTSVYLSREEYSRLLQLAGKRIAKRRYHQRWNGTRFAIDVFEASLDGLVLAEAEADSDIELETIAAPPHKHVDVTNRAEFTGAQLAFTDPEISLGLAASLCASPAPQVLPPVLAIRTLHADDAPIIAAAFQAMGWNKPESQYRGYLVEQSAGDRVVLVALRGADFAGHVTIVWMPKYAPFRDAAIPEIQDLNVVVSQRRRGVASALLDAAEALIAQRSATAGIGVGLHAGYNAAQRLYGLRGYVPDGRGVAHGAHFVQDGEQMPFDDDLVLHLTKVL